LYVILNSGERERKREFSPIAKPREKNLSVYLNLRYEEMRWDVPEVRYQKRGKHNKLSSVKVIKT
jgi:hypothetical protein